MAYVRTIPPPTPPPNRCVHDRRLVGSSFEHDVGTPCRPPPIGWRREQRRIGRYMLVGFVLGCLVALASGWADAWVY